MCGNGLEIEVCVCACVCVCVGIGDDGDRSVEGVRSGLKRVVKAVG